MARREPAALAALATLATLLGGCFESRDVRDDAVASGVRGFVAIAPLIENATTNPAAAEDAMIDFVKSPVAFGAALAAPLDAGAAARMLDAAAQIEAGARANQLTTYAAFPDCVTDNGAAAGCEQVSTTDPVTCDAGDFTLAGTAGRTCGSCPDSPAPGGLCTYNWDIEAAFSDVVDGTALEFQLTTSNPGFDFDGTQLTAMPINQFFGLTVDGEAFVGNVTVCTEQDLTLDGDGVPQAGTLLVRAGEVGFFPPDKVIPAASCLAVTFTGGGGFEYSDCDAATTCL